MRTVRVTSSWPADDPRAAAAKSPRNDLLTESEGPAAGEFSQRHGPFAAYRRTVREERGILRQEVSYQLDAPWCGWLFRIPLRYEFGRPRSARRPWWAPPDPLDARQVRILALLAASTLLGTFLNAVFTQTASFAAKDFAIDSRGQGWGGAVVRLGVLITLPLTMAADRHGRRRLLLAAAWTGPLVAALGALAPSFPVLVATQTVARPLGLVVLGLAAVIASEEMPRSSRAWAASVTAMAGGVGAGVSVIALRLADVAHWGWRLIYVIALAWLIVTARLQRDLPETRRFQATHPTHVSLRTARFAWVAVVAFVGNLFVAPASFYQNRYLDEVRGMSGGQIAVFALCTATPAGIGLLAGGAIADRVGRRVVLGIALPVSAVLITGAYTFGGAPLWLLTFAGATVAAIGVPAYAVYRTELFPTDGRGRAGGWLITFALLGGTAGLLIAGQLLDAGWSYARTMAVLAVAQGVAALVAVTRYPETARRSLEDLNPGDPRLDDQARHGG